MLLGLVIMHYLAQGLPANTCRVVPFWYESGAGDDLFSTFGFFSPLAFPFCTEISLLNRIHRTLPGVNLLRVNRHRGRDTLSCRGLPIASWPVLVLSLAWAEPGQNS